MKNLIMKQEESKLLVTWNTAVILQYERDESFAAVISEYLPNLKVKIKKKKEQLQDLYRGIAGRRGREQKKQIVGKEQSAEKC